MCTYDFSNLYNTLLHNLIKEKLTELIEKIINREGFLYLACNENNAFLLQNNLNDISYGHVREFAMLFIIFLILYLLGLVLSKEEGKDQESIQSSTTPDPEYIMGRVTKTQENITYR